MKDVKIRLAFMFLGSFCFSFCSDVWLRKNKNYVDTFQKELQEKYKNYEVTFQKEYKCAAVMKDEELVINEEDSCTLVFDLYRMEGVFLDMVTVRLPTFVTEVSINSYFTNSGCCDLNFKNLKFETTNYKNFHDVCHFNVELDCKKLKADIFEFYIILCQNNPKVDRKGYTGTLVICEPLKVKLVRKPSVVVDKKDDKAIEQKVINKSNNANQDIIKNIENVKDANIIKEENVEKNINNVENPIPVNQAINNNSDIHKIDQSIFKENQVGNNVGKDDPKIDKHIELNDKNILVNIPEIVDNNKTTEVLLPDVDIKKNVIEDKSASIQGNFIGLDKNKNRPINDLINYENIIYDKQDDKDVDDKGDNNVKNIFDENESIVDKNNIIEEENKNVVNIVDTKTPFVDLRNMSNLANNINKAERESFSNIMRPTNVTDNKPGRVIGQRGVAVERRIVDNSKVNVSKKCANRVCNKEDNTLNEVFSHVNQPAVGKLTRNVIKNAHRNDLPLTDSNGGHSPSNARCCPCRSR